MKIDLHSIVRQASMPTLESFLSSSGRRNEYVRDEDNKVTAYLRRTQHHVRVLIPSWLHGWEGDDMWSGSVPTIDVANITVDEGHRGNHYFSRFLKKVAVHPGADGFDIYVESVMGGDPERGFNLADYFRRLIRDQAQAQDDLGWGGAWAELKQSGGLDFEGAPTFVLLKP